MYEHPHNDRWLWYFDVKQLLCIIHFSLLSPISIHSAARQCFLCFCFWNHKPSLKPLMLRQAILKAFLSQYFRFNYRAFHMNLIRSFMPSSSSSSSFISYCVWYNWCACWHFPFHFESIHPKIPIMLNLLGVWDSDLSNFIWTQSISIQFAIDKQEPLD